MRNNLVLSVFLTIFISLSANALTQKQIIQMQCDQYAIIKKENAQFIELLKTKDEQIDKYQQMLQAEANKPKKVSKHHVEKK